MVKYLLWQFCFFNSQSVTLPTALKQKFRLFKEKFNDGYVSD